MNHACGVQVGAPLAQLGHEVLIGGGPVPVVGSEMRGDVHIHTVDLEDVAAFRIVD